MGLHSSERWFIGFWAAVCLCSECDSLCCWAGEWRYRNKQVQMQGGYSYTVILQERNVWCERLCSVSLASYTETEMSVIIIKKKRNGCDDDEPVSQDHVAFAWLIFGLAFALVLGFRLANRPLIFSPLMDCVAVRRQKRDTRPAASYYASFISN